MVKRAHRLKKNNVNENGRLRFISAVVFLLAAGIIGKLFSLQFMKYELYAALASSQHQAYAKLEPERGKILITDRAGNEEKLFPIAANKEFALVYAVPRDIEDAQKAAEKLYEIFDQEKVKKEVKEKIKRDFAESAGLEAGIMDDFKNVKRELEEKLRMENIISAYAAKLSDKNDIYKPIKQKASEEEMEKLSALNLKGVNFIMQKGRYYPEPEMGGHILGFVGYREHDKIGQYGLEGYFNHELSGKPGSIKAERSANRELIILNNREYEKPINGSDLVLTVNRSIQYTACTKLNAAVKKHGADGGSVIVMDPETGAILAMCSAPDYDPNNYYEAESISYYNNPAIFNQFEPGSIFKAVTMSAALDQGSITPETTYNDSGFVMIEGWSKPLRNSDFEKKGGRGQTDMITVIEQSLNTGVIFAMQKTGAKTFADYVKNFGFGEKTGIELETENAGNIKRLLVKNIRPSEAATASYGQGITVTPLQMLSAYSAIANGGILMKPYLVKEIIKPDNSKIATQPREIRRVVSAKTAAIMGALLVGVVENGHGKRARVDGYYIAGKTGTAQVPKKGGGYEEKAHIGSFVGFGPVEEPVFVMLVKIDNPKDVEWAESSAAPLFGEIAEFILNYYQVLKDR